LLIQKKSDQSSFFLQMTRMHVPPQIPLPDLRPSIPVRQSQKRVYIQSYTAMTTTESTMTHSSDDLLGLYSLLTRSATLDSMYSHALRQEQSQSHAPLHP
jgi:hypothetical protein